MKTLERGPRKKGKKLYRFKQLLNFYGPPFFIWRTRIDVEERRVLVVSRISDNECADRKESQIFGK